MKYIKHTFRMKVISLILTLGMFVGTRCTRIASAAEDNSKAKQPVPPAAMPEVVVTGQQDNRKKSYNAESLSLSKYTQPLLDTPQSVTVVTSQVMKDQGATTLRDALRNVSGISLAAGEAGAQGDNLTIRGFSARNDIYMDGIRDFGSYYRDPFNMESVEVLKGPASVMFGRGSTGGVVNQESKTPKLDPKISGTAVLGTDLTKRSTIDINEPLKWNGRGIEGAAFRLNAMVHDSDVAERRVAENKRWGIAPSLAFGLGTETRLLLSYFHQTENDVPDYGIPFVLSRPPAVARDTYYGFKNDNYLRTHVNVVNAKLEHDFGDDFTLRNQFRYGDYGRSARITEPRVPTTLTATTPVDNLIPITRGQIATDSTESYLGDQTDFTAKFNTFDFEHSAVGGMEIARETSSPVRPTFTGVPTAKLFDPDDNIGFSGTSTDTSNVNAMAQSFALYLVDTLKLTEKWSLMGGIRWDLVYSHYRQSVATATVPATSFDRTDSLPSWRGGIVYKPIPIASIYFAAGTSFNPSIESLALAANTANLDPEKTRTYELGTKWEIMQKRLTLNMALFHSIKTNARTPDPLNSAFNVLSGEQRVDGIEVGATGKLTDKWQIFTGYTFMKGKVVKSNNPLEKNNPIANTPDHTFSLWTTYDLPWRLQVGGGMNLVSGRNATATKDVATGMLKTVQGYMTFDAMVKYQLNKNIAFRVNGYNLFNKYYFDTIHPSHIIPGAGRTVLFGVEYEF